MSFRLSALLLLATVVATPDVHYFRYERPLLNTPAQPQQTCALLDDAVFAHTSPQLSSLRLYNGQTETPYVISYAARVESAPASINLLNIGTRKGSTSFDAAMPDGSYNNIDLNINAHDFIATVRVSGSQTQTGAGATNLGAFTIFDFSRQKLGRSTVLHLPESDFRYLHFRIDGPIQPDQITALSTGRLRTSEPQYLTIATSSSVEQKDRDSIIEFSIPANVPVDRIFFSPGAQPVNFSRQVTITVMPATTRPQTDAEESTPPTITSGNLLRIHTVQNGHKIDEEELALDAPAYASTFTSDSATKWTVTIHNEDDAPISLESVSLQMIARSLCFDAQPGASYKLYYGDAALSSPRYDYAALFVLDKSAAQTNLGPEQQNPQFQPRPDTRPFTEKHPALLWIVLIAALFLLGVIALRSGKQLKQS
jgi:hypothetical protein